MSEPTDKVLAPTDEPMEASQKPPTKLVAKESSAKESSVAKESIDADESDEAKEPVAAKPVEKTKKASATTDKVPLASEKAELETPRRRRGRDFVGVLACVAVVLFARASLADHYVVPSGSMEPTVEVGDRVVVAKYAYGLRLPLSDTWVARWSDPHRGDVVVLESPEGGTILLKRVIAVPGDTVTVREGGISINGVREPVLNNVENLDGKRHDVSLALGGGPDWGPTTLPPGRFLVMGDNRGNSRDGRMFGLVDGATILGRAEKIYYRGGAFSWRDL